MNQKTQYFAMITNDAVGRVTLTGIKTIAKKNGWKVVCRGRNKNRKAQAEQHALAHNLHPRYIHDSFRQSLPIKYSDRLAVYVKYNDPVERWTVNITPQLFLEMTSSGKVK